MKPGLKFGWLLERLSALLKKRELRFRLFLTLAQTTGVSYLEYKLFENHVTLNLFVLFVCMLISFLTGFYYVFKFLTVRKCFQALIFSVFENHVTGDITEEFVKGIYRYNLITEL